MGGNMTQKKKAIVASLSLIAIVGLILTFSFLDQILGDNATSQKIYTLADGPTDPNHMWIDEEVNDFSSYVLTGSGTADNPYQISSEKDLAFLAWSVYTDNAYNGAVTRSGNTSFFYEKVYFQQTKDLDLSAYYWQPIGAYYDRNGTIIRRYFSGNYDGMNNSIAGIFTQSGTGNGFNYQGLFGYVWLRDTSFRLMNINVVDSYVRNYGYSGSICGQLTGNGGMINCHSSATIESNMDCIGGLVGPSNLIENCSFSGIVIGKNYVGGLTGSGRNIINCFNTGAINGVDYVGGISGFAEGSVNLCYNEGQINATGNYVGGIVGTTRNPIEKCYNLGNVSGEDYVGGIFGYTSPSIVYDIKNNYNKGEIVGGNYVGGIFGYGRLKGISLYNMGKISGSSSIGGIGGYLNGFSTEYSGIVNCFNIGNIEGQNLIGGILGETADMASIEVKNSYYGGDCLLNIAVGSWDADTLNVKNLGVELAIFAKDENWYSSSEQFEDGTAIWNELVPWDFLRTWYIDGELNEGFPMLYLEEPTITVQYWTDVYAIEFEQGYDLSGRGTSSNNPYLIQSEKDLIFLSWTIENGKEYGVSSSDQYYYNNKYFKQTKDLSFEGYYWLPIGNLENNFSGNYDGDGHIISNLETLQTEDNQGLFGYISYRSTRTYISNLGIVNSSIKGSQYVGAFVGRTNILRFTNCFNESSVKGENHVSGFVGMGSSVTFENCYNSGNIVAKNQASGFISYLSGALRMSNCYNSGDISSFNRGAAGFSSYAYGSGGCRITDSYNTGNIICKDSEAGGLFGWMAGGNTVSWTIENCYNSGSVYAIYRVGGLAGLISAYITYSSQISDSQNYGDITGISNVGGIAGGFSYCDSIGNANYGVVKGESNVGGISGGQVSTEFSNNINYGNILGNSNVGGIASSVSSSGSVNQNINFGLVEGQSSVGGIVATSNSDMTQNMNFGSIKGTEYVGGIVGSLYANIYSCFSKGEVSGSLYVGGIAGRVYASANRSMDSCGFEGSLVGESCGGLVGQAYTSNSSRVITITNSYFISSDTAEVVGNTSGSGTISMQSLLIIFKQNEEDIKSYIGSDFSGFAWINGESYPMPKGLVWLGEIWEESVTEQDLIDNGFVLAG